jgi:hypothetical protein
MEGIGPVRVGYPLELGCGRTRPFEVSGRDRDGDIDGKKACAVKVTRLVVERRFDAGCRSLDVLLRESQNGEPGLWVPPELVRLHERLLGRSDISHPQPHLADLVEGLRRVGDVEVDQFVRRASRFLLGFAPGPSQPHD